MLRDFEGRIDQARSVLQGKEAELAGCKLQVRDMYEQYCEERDKAEKIAGKLQVADRERQAMEVRYRGEVEEMIRAKEEEGEIAERRGQMRVKELEKRIEVMKINHEERLNLAIDNKDKEV